MPVPRPLVRAAKLRERTLDGGDPTCGHTCVARRRVQLGMPKRTRAIMLTFYVIETEGSVAKDSMLAGAVRAFVRDTRSSPQA